MATSRHKRASRWTHESHDGAKLGSKLAVLSVKGVKRDQKGTKEGVKRSDEVFGSWHVGAGGGFGGSQNFDLSFSKRFHTLRSRLEALGGE